MNLTNPQKLVYDMEKFAGGAISIVCGSMLINTDKSVAEMKKAVNELYRLNTALRIRVSEKDGQPYQCVTEYQEQDIDVLNFKSKEELDNYADEYAKKPLDSNGSLCDVKIVVLPDKKGLFAKLHHLISDAWTLSLLATQFNRLLNGEEIEAYSYADYVKAEELYAEGKRYGKDKDYFISQFKKCDEVTYLSDKQSHSYDANRATFIIERKKADKINKFVTEHETSVFNLFMAALATYINRIKMNAEKFYIGTAVLNRNGIKEQNTMGMFINTAPVLFELTNEGSFAENLESVQDSIISVLRHQKYNYGTLLEELRRNHGFSEKLYDVILSYQNAKVLGGGIETTWYHSGMQTESLQIHIDDRDGEGIFRVHYDYLTEKFSEHEVEKINEHICNLLFDAIENSDKKFYELEILSADEKKTLLFDFNNTAVEYPTDKCVHQLFEEQVEKNPDKVAVVACDKTLTYKELNEEANRIAHSLIEKGIGIGDIVAFMLPRKSYLISTMIGILKSGAAYMPIDPDYPQDRIEYMLKESRVDYCIKVTNLDELIVNSNDSNLNKTVENTDAFCALHTSGSTGKPKMSLLKHSSMMNFITANSKFWQDIDTVVSATIVTFDAFQMDSVLSLAQGKKLVLANEDEIYNQALFEKLFEHSDSIMFFSTPTKIENYIENSINKTSFSKINSFVIGGEVFTEHLLDIIKTVSPDSNVYNVYGPTETTICAMVDELQKSKEITIGKPIANTQIYIVDKYMKPVPIGVIGELCIAGDCVGAGYLNRPELTAEKFVDNPFGEGKMYKTGDLAYWREDGNIAYVGRNDFQVKIRGLRIELGEIENAISSVEGVNLSVVVVRKNSEGRQLICAFYTGEEKSVQEIKSVIGEKLPKYMLPHIITHLDEMPLTSSGKISRKTLPEIDLENISNDTEYVAPTTETEKLLCAIVSETLGIGKIGVEDDFFELGGDSLKAIEYVSKAHAQGIYFTLQDVFDNPTVKSLCEFMTAKDKQHNTYNKEDFIEIHKMLESNLDDEFVPAKSDMGDVLVTGATGFLGIHVVSEFLENENGKVYCLVRGKNDADAVARFEKLLNYYFDGKYVDLIDNRIIVLCGDVEKENLGLAVIPEVTMVINTAASVKHYGSYKYFYDINVSGTINSMNVAKEVDARFIQVSTLSVSGNSMADIFDAIRSDEYKTFSENDLYIDQQLDNVYIRSKFEAEYAILKEMLNGLKANIIRVGNLTNRASDFKFQPNYQSNAFLSRVKAVLEMGMFPDYLIDLYAEFSPIDDTANAVIKIAQHFNDRKTVFHVNSQKVVYFDKFIEYTGKLGINLDVLTGKEFADRLAVLEHNETTRYIYEALINDMDENGNLVYDSNIHIENELTLKYLDKIGFDWSEIGLDYLKGYFDYFRNLGYLEV